ncbi:MAG: mannose-6-phosphate isomerase, class I [Brevibacterium yomogidense]
MQRLKNTRKDYAWGSPTGIPEILGQEPDGTPVAELWVGAHPGAPSTVDGRSLDALIAEDPARFLGEESLARFGPRLPFLLKVLSARSALSIQSHPTREQAEAGFAREEAAGIPADAPHRTYRDAWHKPELLYALDEFHALCGFRPVPAVLATLERFAHALDSAGAPAEARDALAAWQDALTPPPAAGDPADAVVLRAAVERLLGEPARFGALADALAAALVDSPVRSEVEADDPSLVGSSTDPSRTLMETHADFPHDPGPLVAVMLRRHLLQAGESLVVESGSIHAYLRGMGVEIMASSDNVLRGGLTAKHVDVCELVRTARFDTHAPDVLAPDDAGGLRGRTDDFVLTVITDAGDRLLERPGALTLLCTEGAFTLRTEEPGRHGTTAHGPAALDLRRGDSVWIAADEQRPAVTGTGALFVASTGL